jgi:hypothetical protein
VLIKISDSTKIGTTMSLKSKVGVDTKGKDVFKTQNFANVKVATTDDAILAVGMALGTLLEFNLSDVSRHDQTSISE